MRILFGTLIAVGLVVGAASCAGKSKNNVGSTAAGAGDNATGGATYGGATYGGATQGDNPCGAAKSDPCGGGE